jgi:hypothetical protein
MSTKDDFRQEAIRRLETWYALSDEAREEAVKHFIASLGYPWKEGEQSRLSPSATFAAGVAVGLLSGDPPPASRRAVPPADEQSCAVCGQHVQNHANDCAAAKGYVCQHCGRPYE